MVDVPSRSEFTALTARVTALEQAATAPPDQPPAGSEPQSYGLAAPADAASLNWAVDFFDDFTGTFARQNTPPNWYTGPDRGGFTTGAQYRGAPMQYGCFWSTTGWGGYGPQLDDLANLSMSNGALHFGGTWEGGQPHNCTAVAAFATPWGLWECRMKCAQGANGNHKGIGNGVWLDGSTWPQMGEFDLTETGWGTTGWAGTVHIGPATDLKPIMEEAPTFPDGSHWYDGEYHTYAALITPAYIAEYIDGVLVWQSNDPKVLSNISTATDPPEASAAGSFGYLAGSLSPQLDYGATQWWFMFGLNSVGQMSAAQYPMACSVDWIRHSSLHPPTGGPHV